MTAAVAAMAAASAGWAMVVVVRAAIGGLGDGGGGEGSGGEGGGGDTGGCITVGRRMALWRARRNST